MVTAHNNWKRGVDDPGQVSVTFSSQIEAFVADIGAQALMISMHPDAGSAQDELTRFIYRPKKARNGIAYYVEELKYAVWLFQEARRFGADLVLIDSGTIVYALMTFLKLQTRNVVPILHNTIWPKGFKQKSLKARFIGLIDGLFLRSGPAAVIAVSPECERQLREIAGHHRTPVHQIRALFLETRFANIPAPPPAAPFTVLFVGRADRSKGLLDLPEMAAIIESSHPGLVRWVVCGDGPDLATLRALVDKAALGDVFDIRGWTPPATLLQIYSHVHATIVPTRSTFAEGMAMTAVEAILAGRPVVTNPVVPALEVLRPAAVEARPDDPASYAQAILSIALDRDRYEALCAACPPLRPQFYDEANGLRQALHRINRSWA